MANAILNFHLDYLNPSLSPLSLTLHSFPKGRQDVNDSEQECVVAKAEASDRMM